jgi:hypothetical protein
MLLMATGCNKFNIKDGILVEFVPWEKKKDIKVNIPVCNPFSTDTIKVIAKNVFSKYRNITSITIPRSVTSIEDNFKIHALRSFEVDKDNTDFCSLDGVLFNKDMTILIEYPGYKEDTAYSMPDSVKIISPYSFYYCTNIKSVVIPNSATNIKQSAFSYCIHLASITIPDSVKTIENQVFSGCRNLTSITIPNSVTSIGDSAFIDCSSLETIALPNTLTRIGYAAFEKSGLKSVIIPGSVITVEPWAFTKSYRLDSVIIPGSVKFLGGAAFAGCGLKWVEAGWDIPLPAASYDDYGLFYGNNLSECTLVVPAGTKDNYLAAPVWQDFGNIIEKGN